jgi:hypothetical protein
MKRKVTAFVFAIILMALPAYMQSVEIIQDYLRLNARTQDPLYTTYAAAMERSWLYGDKAYKMDYYSGCMPVTYSSDQAGRMYGVWKVDEVVILRADEYYSRPFVNYSFPDMMVMEYEPFRGIRVTETFLVYSSEVAIVEIVVTNIDNIPHKVDLYPILELGNDSLQIMGFDTAIGGYVTHRYESPYRLISSLKMQYPYPTMVRDLFITGTPTQTYGGYSGNLGDFFNVMKTDFYSDRRTDSLNMKVAGYVDFISLHLKAELKPGETTSFRYVRGVIPDTGYRIKETVQVNDTTGIRYPGSGIRHLASMSLQPFFDANLKLYSNIPRIPFKTNDQKLVYLSALNLARGCMYPPSGLTSYNFYVFSRNPIWGWGHGHQVLHESLSMMAYAYLDPVSAQNSQRVYMEQQREDGLIAYRHGPRGMQDYPHKGMSTTSAPFFSWINLEIYQVSHDSQFLADAYASGTKYLEWLIRNRDTDKDGTYEWGPYGIIENVRDWYNAVFQVSKERFLDVDKEDISDELECLDLTLMMIKEARCLSEMAKRLGKEKESRKWLTFAEKTSVLVNERMWDEASGFYYSVNKKDHSFHFMTRDLKRQEIIAFLALWAEAAPKDRADRLVKTLTDPGKFWRRYGIPTLAADDAWYSPNVDYCCKWNGPVWLLWNYMVYDGLKAYGYDAIARELAIRMTDAVTVQLSRNHNFWESYSPDNEVLNCPPNYIWDAIIAKVLIREFSK